MKVKSRRNRRGRKETLTCRKGALTVEQHAVRTLQLEVAADADPARARVDFVATAGVRLLAAAPGHGSADRER